MTKSPFYRIPGMYDIARERSTYHQASQDGQRTDKHISHPRVTTVNTIDTRILLSAAVALSLTRAGLSGEGRGGRKMENGGKRQTLRSCSTGTWCTDTGSDCTYHRKSRGIVCGTPAGLFCWHSRASPYQSSLCSRQHVPASQHASVCKLRAGLCSTEIIEISWLISHQCNSEF